jgi:hypothetical protein
MSSSEIRRTLQRMANAIVHRGPDEEGFFEKGARTLRWAPLLALKSNTNFRDRQVSRASQLYLQQTSGDRRSYFEQSSRRCNRKESRDG